MNQMLGHQFSHSEIFLVVFISQNISQESFDHHLLRTRIRVTISTGELSERVSTLILDYTEVVIFRIDSIEQHSTLHPQHITSSHIVFTLRPPGSFRLVRWRLWVVPSSASSPFRPRCLVTWPTGTRLTSRTLGGHPTPVSTTARPCRWVCVWVG